MSDQIRRLYDLELGPEVRDWLDSFSDSDFKRVGEVCGMLAEKASELGGHDLITWKGLSGNCGSGFTMFDKDHLLVYC